MRSPVSPLGHHHVRVAAVQLVPPQTARARRKPRADEGWPGVRWELAVVPLGPFLQSCGNQHGSERVAVEQGVGSQDEYCFNSYYH